MSTLDPTIQSRVRQLLGLRGGPNIEAIEAVQPVVQIAGFPNDRQPQLESGDMLVRRFTASGSQAAVVGQYSQIQIRTADPSSLLWITRLVMYTGGAAYGARICRSTNITALTYGTANWTDWRMPYNSVTGAFEVAVGAVAVPSTVYGPVEFWLGPNTVLYPCDYIIQAGTLEGLEVRLVTANAPLAVTFEGILFSRLV